MMRLLSLAVLAAYLAAALPMKYEADDFGDLRAIADPVTAVRDFYNGWSGRYTYALAKSAAKALPVWLPTMLVILALWWLVPDKVLLVAVALASPVIIHSLYWQAGMLNYGLFLAGAVALVRLRLRPLTAFLLAFGTVGVSDTGAVALVVVTAGYALWTRQPSALAAFVGALVGFAVLVSAPGTAIRAAYFQRADLLTTLPYAARATGVYLANALKQAPLAVVALVPLGGLRHHGKVLALMLVALAVCFAVSLGAYYSTGGPLPARAAIVPITVCFAALRTSGRRRDWQRWLSVAILVAGLWQAAGIARTWLDAPTVTEPNIGSVFPE